MPGNFNKYNINECFHAIEKFLLFSESLGKEKLSALTEIIFYYMEPRLAEILISDSTTKCVIEIKDICGAKDQTTRSNFLLALTTICYKYAPSEAMNVLSCDDTFPARIMALFHHQALINSYQPIKFTADLESMSRLSYELLAVLLFCTKTFVPDLLICGNFVDGPNKQDNLNALKGIVNCLTSKTSFSYRNNCLGEMGFGEMPVFLKSVSKATRLVLDENLLYKWTAADWKHFIEEVEHNKQLTSISINNNNLDLCCKNPEKFKYILRLIAIPHLKKLYLHNNNLGNLPPEQSQKLQKALTESPIKFIGLKHIPKGTGGTSGLFATKSIELKTDAQEGACSLSRAEKDTMEGCRI